MLLYGIKWIIKLGGANRWDLDDIRKRYHDIIVFSAGEMVF